ncbi:MAG: cytochrome c3 family protein [Deltaproteobacteria bacterium]|nr:cytochrome c3 family protein [Deltaproteobacteria bacterium]
MTKRASFQRRTGIILAVFLFIAFAGLIRANSRTEGEDTLSITMPDIILIDLPAVPGGEQMPAVRFFHDRHTGALKDKNCGECHLKKDQSYVFKFKRTKDNDTETDMNIYHNNCISCHTNEDKANNIAGPLNGECRSCHDGESEPISSWVPISFDKSLHYRHESSGYLASKYNTEGVNCGACHHEYDKTSDKIFYKKGKEESCYYCHKPTVTKEVSAIRTASHQSCVKCHQQLTDVSEKAGPVKCAGCHEKAEQQKIKVVKDVPRLKRNQPDTVLLANWTLLPGTTNDSAKKYMKSVAFNHETHESNAANCRSCHHDTLKRCGDCHTETGKKEGGDVRLEESMHDRDLTKSCAGCHRVQQEAASCAGCHEMIAEKSFKETACDKCHSVDLAGGMTFPIDQETKEVQARQALSATQVSSPPVSDKLIPEEVTIDGIKDKYEGAKFPHRMVLRKLEGRIKDSRMAAFFHGDNLTLCAGCHHNSPASTQPPKCASCHGKTTKASNDGRPGLIGAYHGQCITCHQKMNIEKPAATDCKSCHKKRT